MTGRTNVLHLDVPETVRLDKLARGQLFRFANYEKDIYMITESASDVKGGEAIMVIDLATGEVCSGGQFDAATYRVNAVKITSPGV